MFDVPMTLLAGLITAVVWFILGGVFYMNPFVGKMYDRAENEATALRKWSSKPKYMITHFTANILECLIFAFAFAFIQTSLPTDTLFQGIAFGGLLTAVRIVPRLFDMWIQTNYPGRLLSVELINGTIGSFVIGISLAYSFQYLLT